MTFRQEPPQQPKASPPAEDVADRVRAYAAAALDALPEEYVDKLHNVRFFIRRVLSAEDSERLRIWPGRLYGLMKGSL